MRDVCPFQKSILGPMGLFSDTFLNLLNCHPDWLKSLEEPYVPPNGTEEEIVDIDLDDPEVERAATKIQAGFKGHQTRKGIREKTTTQVAGGDIAVDVPVSTGK